MKKTHVLFCAFLVLSVLGDWGCATMMAEWRRDNCNYEGAYRAGMNDARNQAAMDSGFSSACGDMDRDAVNKGYREGYTAGTPASQKNVTVVVLPGGKIASQAERKCLSAYGKTECGYHCLESYGNVACAEKPSDNCVKAFGELRCGENCRQEFGSIVCDD